MKNSILLGLLLLCFNPGFTQDLIPNGSFEINTFCPSNPLQGYLAIPWISPNPNFSNGYFNSCASTSTHAGIPVNCDSLLGYQQSHTGDAYSGINCYSPMGPGFRQYLTVALVDTLIANKQYTLTFFVSLLNYSKYGIDGMGAYFSAQMPNCPTFNCVLNVSPQISNPAGTILLDTVNWMEISGSFVASGGERFLTIGNFKSDSTTQKAISRPSSYAWGTFYYIDDVSLYEDTSLGVEKVERNMSFSVHPNPASTFINISQKDNSNPFQFRIENLNGALIREFTLLEKETSMDISFLSNGVYIYHYISANRKISTGKLVVLH